MTAPRVLSFPDTKSNRNSRDLDTARGCEMSFENVFGPRGFDLRAYQASYPDRVRGYFRGTGLSASEIAFAYGVTERTAQNWLEGVVGAHGAVIVCIATTDPEGFARHFNPGRAA